MNETYWVVVDEDGEFGLWSVATTAGASMRRFVGYGRAVSESEIPALWNKHYDAGARCKKVMLVLEK